MEFSALAGKSPNLVRSSRNPLTDFPGCARQRDALFSSACGEWHRKERTGALEIMAQLGETHPELFPSEFLCRTLDSTTPMYISEIPHATGSAMRTLPDIAKKTELRREALYMATTGATLREFPTVWLIRHAAGLWRYVVIPKLGDRASRSTWGPPSLLERWR